MCFGRRLSIFIAAISAPAHPAAETYDRVFTTPTEANSKREMTVQLSSKSLTKMLKHEKVTHERVMADDSSVHELSTQ